MAEPQFQFQVVVEPNQQVVDLNQQQQQLAAQQTNSTVAATSATSVSSLKTVKQSKKVTTSTKSSTVKSVKSSSTSSSSASSSSAISESKTTSSSSKMTSSSSSSTLSASSSKSVAIQQSSETYGQHVASIAAKEHLKLDVESAKAAATNQLQQLLLIASDIPEVAAIRLSPEDFKTDQAGSKAAVLSFNVSEFESQSVEVLTDGNKIQVHAKKKHINQDGEERSEEFSRVYELPSPEPIDPSKINTSIFQDGVLTIELPVSTSEIVVTVDKVEEPAQG